MISPALKDADLNGNSSLHSLLLQWIICSFLFSSEPWERDRGEDSLFFTSKKEDFPLHLGALGGKWPCNRGRTENQHERSVVWERKVAADLLPSWTAVKQKEKPYNIDEKKRKGEGAAPAWSCSGEGWCISDAVFSSPDCHNCFLWPGYEVDEAECL